MRLGATRSNRNHQTHYEFAAAQVSGKVLDAGCGAGYGSDLLAANASFVVGIDQHEKAITYARKHYQRKGYPAVRFEVADVATAKPAEAPFDAVVCVDGDDALLGALRRQMKPSGKLVISNRLRSPEEFRALLLDVGFQNVEFYGLHGTDDQIAVAW